MASNSGCASRSFPFTYLGLPIGSNMSLTSSWHVLLDRFQSKLSSWKADLLYIGGRHTLIKAVLGSLGIYYFSIFKVFESVLNSLVRSRAIFLGGSHEARKLAWIKWKNVISSYDNGGLNIGSLKAFNLALIQKWRWKLLSHKNTLWVKVIKALHGQEGGFDNNGCIYNGTLARIVGSSNFLHSNNIIPNSSFRLQAGCGTRICFWKDTWVGDSNFNIRYNRLYRLAFELVDALPWSSKFC
ncbi:hypothetical protein Tco_1323682 [Tanacetum coccineum]